MSGLVLTRDVERAELADRLRSGQLRRTRRGAYHPPERSISPAIDRHHEAQRQIAALTAQLTTPMWFSHESAALLWDLAIVYLSPRCHLTQLYTQNGRTDRRVVRPCAELPESDRAELRGVPLTGFERTVLDCVLSLPVERGLVIADSALRRGADPLDLAARLGRLTGHRGVRRARTVLGLADVTADTRNFPEAAK
jgi:predicted transcriptional regulator of viral defense system